MKIDLSINWKIHTPEGVLISEQEHKANSLVKAFIQLLNVQMAQTGQYIKISAGTSPTINANSANFRVTGPSGNTSYGILVGTGTTAVALDDYAMGALIAHGTSANQLSYGAVAIDATTSVSGSSAFFAVSRSFTNGSGGNITVQEVGLMSYGTSYYMLLDRSLSSQTITNGNIGTCAYKFTITV